MSQEQDIFRMSPRIGLFCVYQSWESEKNGDEISLVKRGGSQSGEWVYPFDIGRKQYPNGWEVDMERGWK